jgi:hypothetical protein
MPCSGADLKPETSCVGMWKICNENKKKHIKTHRFVVCTLGDFNPNGLSSFSPHLIHFQVFTAITGVTSDSLQCTPDTVACREPR